MAGTWMSSPTCPRCCQLCGCRRGEQGVSGRQTFSLLCCLGLAEITSVDPAGAFAVAAKVLCHRVLPLNPGPAVLGAVLPAGRSGCVKRAQADRPAETFQEATCLFFFFFVLALGALQGFTSEAGMSYGFVRPGGGLCCCPAGGPCHFPPRTARLGAAGARRAVVPCRFHSAGAGRLGAQAALPAVASQVFKRCSYRFVSPHAPYEAIRSHTKSGTS